MYIICLICQFCLLMVNSHKLHIWKTGILPTETPILLIPGMGASRLFIRGGPSRFNDFPDRKRQIYPPTVQNFICHFNEWKSHIMESKGGLTTMGFGDKNALALTSESAIFSLFAASLNKYEEILKQPNTFAIPYDFRRMDESPYMNELSTKICKYIESFEKPVILMCHSTGGLLIHWLLHQQTKEWKDKWVDKVINVNVPFGGVVGVLDHCVRPDTNINRLIGRDIFRSFGASILNLPNPKYLKNILEVDGEDVVDYLKYFNFDDIKRRWICNKDVIDTFSKETGVETHIIYSTKNEHESEISPENIENIEIETIVAHELDEMLCNVFLKKTPVGIKVTNGKVSIKYGKGDGVVSLDSLMVPRFWDQSKLTFHYIPRYEHSSILQHWNLQKNIID